MCEDARLSQVSVGSLCHMRYRPVAARTRRDHRHLLNDDSRHLLNRRPAAAGHRRRHRSSGQTSREPRSLAATLDARAATRLTPHRTNRLWVGEAGPKPWYNHQMTQDVGALKLARRNCRTGLDATCNIACKILGVMIQLLSDVSLESYTSGATAVWSPRCDSSFRNSVSTLSA